MKERRALGLAAACYWAIVSMACAPATAEEQLLTKFFQVARTLDSSITTSLATVGFNPRTEGSVQVFRVTTIGPEQRRALRSEGREAVVSSLTIPGEPDLALAGLVVEMIAKQVTIEADVRSPEGTISPRTMVVTLQRAVVTGAGPTREGRWIITDLRQAPASRTSRATSSVPQS